MSLIEELRDYLERIGIKTYNEFNSKMSCNLRKWNDEKPIWCELPNGLIMKFVFEERQFGDEFCMCYSYGYSSGGGSGKYNYDSVEDFFKRCIRCHNIDFKIEAEQLSLGL